MSKGQGQCSVREEVKGRGGWGFGWVCGSGGCAHRGSDYRLHCGFVRGNLRLRSDTPI